MLKIKGPIVWKSLVFIVKHQRIQPPGGSKREKSNCIWISFSPLNQLKPKNVNLLIAQSFIFTLFITQIAIGTFIVWVFIAQCWEFWLSNLKAQGSFPRESKFFFCFFLVWKGEGSNPVHFFPKKMHLYHNFITIYEFFTSFGTYSNNNLNGCIKVMRKSNFSQCDKKINAKITKAWQIKRKMF